jgi:uncharacterized membrane protein YgcG
MRIVRLALAAAVAALALVPALVLAAGPPFPDPVENKAVYDTAGVLDAATIAKAEAAIDRFEADTGAEIVVYTQLVRDGITSGEADAHAIALIDQWGVGRAEVGDGMVILFDLNESDPCHGQVRLYAGAGFRDVWLSNDDRQVIFENDMLPKLRECDLNGALTAAMDKIRPFPDPVEYQAVYDTAGVLDAATIAKTEAAIDRIESDTGAEIVVYTQLVRDGITSGEAEAHARALMDQWGVGRAGVNDGLVVLFDLKQSDPCHGQVQLYAGEGYRETWLSNEDRQAIFESDMLPKLRGCDLNGALTAAIDKLSMVPTWRVVNAVLGLVLAPLILFGIIGFSLYRWFRSGKDPVYLDDPSILMPAPPPGLTPAAGAAVRDGKVTRRALTAASLDLAARGSIAFQAVPSEGLLGGQPDIGIYTRDSRPEDPVEQARLQRVRRRSMDDATEFLLGRLQELGGGDGYIEPDGILELGSDVSDFDSRLEKHLVKEGWIREAPSAVTGRWSCGGILVFVGGIAALVLGVILPSSGMLLVGIALSVAAICLLIVGAAMPARTKDGAVVAAMLEAYRRTLEKTMAMSRSMGQVVEASAIPLIEDPDDAVVWGVALGLQEEVEGVLGRSAEDLATGRSTTPYLPLWYSAGGLPGRGDSGFTGLAPGMMSSSPIPNFGGMMAALGTIGNSPASSSSGGGGGGGGFSGGSSGGGGGGAGGGF